MSGMLGGLEARMKQETNQMKEQLAVAVDAVGDLGIRMDRAEKRLGGLSDGVNWLVAKNLSNLPPPAALPPAPAPSRSGPFYAAALLSNPSKDLDDCVTTWKLARSPAKRKEEHYWRCRKALRLRPIPAGDPVARVKEFMADHLKLGQTFIDSVGPFSVRKVPFGPAARVQGEVVVTFDSTDTRDAVRSAARNLAGKGSDYGVRLKLPDHLKSTMKALQAISFEVKKKYPTAKRNVLFDDETQDLVLDFSIAEEPPWRRMTSAQARDRKKKMPGPGPENKLSLEDGEINRILDQSTSQDDADATLE